MTYQYPTECKFCGAPLPPHHSSGGLHTTFGDGFGFDCFSFNFWAEKVAWRMRGDRVFETPYGHRGTDGESYAVRIGGTHYIVRDGMVDDRGRFLGFGGSKQYAVITDGPNKGILIASNNWWCQGDIPPEFAAMLPNNAKFITKEDYDAFTTVRQAAPFGGPTHMDASFFK